MGSELMFLSFGLLSLAAAVFVVIERLNILDGDWIGRDPVLILIASEIAVGFMAVSLRRLELAAFVAPLLFLVFWFGGLGVSAAAGLAAFGPGSPVSYLVIPPFADRIVILLNVSYVIVGVITWVLITADADAYRNIRASTQSAHGDSFPNHQWQRTVGTPGRSLLGTGAEVSGHARRPAIAQQLMAPVLDELLTIPSVTVVHGIRSPRHPQIIIGHAVVAGSRIALIDPMLWEPADYRLDRNGRVLRNFHISEDHTSALPIVMDDIAAVLPGAPIRAWIAVLPTIDGELNVSNEDADAVVTIGTVESTLREVGDWLSEEGDHINVFALQFAMAFRLE